jgi:hypothetical protein
MESAWSRGHPRPRDIPAFNRRQLAGRAISGLLTEALWVRVLSGDGDG